MRLNHCEGRLGILHLYGMPRLAMVCTLAASAGCAPGPEAEQSTWQDGSGGFRAGHNVVDGAMPKANGEPTGLDAGETFPPDHSQPDSGTPNELDHDAAVNVEPSLDASAKATDGGEDASTPDAFIPLPIDGQPLPPGGRTWTTVTFPDAPCRDGSPSGLMVSRGSSDKLMIFMEGGGRCVDPQTCDLNAENLADWELIRSFSMGGVLDRDDSRNPVRDWNWVYVMYCSGDRHGGANPDASVPGVGPQQFMGYANMKRFLNRIVPTFPDVTDVLLTGVSAGGFGVAYNSVLVQRAFPTVKVRMVMDSAPFVSSAVLAECDQAMTRTMQRTDQTFLADCGDACPEADDHWFDFGIFMAETFSDRPWGLIAPVEDLIERAYFGIGVDGCMGTLDLFNPEIPAAPFRAEVLAFRERARTFPNFATYYIDSDTHTLLVFDEFYTTTVNDVPLVDWFEQIANGEATDHVGP